MPRRKKATPGQDEPEVVAAVVEEEPVSPPAPPVPEPEPVEEPAKVIKVGGYIATPHGWRPAK